MLRLNYAIHAKQIEIEIDRETSGVRKLVMYFPAELVRGRLLLFSRRITMINFHLHRLSVHIVSLVPKQTLAPMETDPGKNKIHSNEKRDILGI
jgi:hypothetical protein